MKFRFEVFWPVVLVTGMATVVPAMAQQCKIWDSTLAEMDCSVPDNFDKLLKGYKTLFHSACVGHDTCSVTIGKTKRQCDDAFYEDMKEICKNEYPLNPIAAGGMVQPVKAASCAATARAFYRHVSGEPADGSSWYANQAQAKRSYCEPCNASWDGHHLLREGGRPTEGTSTVQLWSGLPDSEIDAAIGWKSDRYRYFFIGGQYYRYDMEQDRVSDGYPRDNGAWGLMGKWKNPDAAIYWPNRGKKGKVYFFKGDEYMRFDVKTDKMDRGPSKISKYWKGVPNDIDAAFYTPRTLTLNDVKSRDKVYFFKDDQYWRYDLKRDSVDTGYPRRTVDWWHGVWIRGLEAAVPKQSDRYPTRVYFFKDGKYKRYLTEWNCATN